jgi:hypothetical protein
MPSRFPRGHAGLGCQGPPCSAREDSCLMLREGLVSRDTRGVKHARHARQHKREGVTRSAIMLVVRAFVRACLRLCTCDLRRKPLAVASASRFDARPLTAWRSRSSTRRSAPPSSCSLHAALVPDGAKFHQDAPRSTVLRECDVRPAVALLSVVRSRELGRSLRREVSVRSQREQSRGVRSAE